jgi:hypothetical protein
MRDFEILHTFVPPNHPTLTEGDWFFDTGQWCHCASIGRGNDGAWSVDIYLVPHWKSDDEVGDTFVTKQAAIEFISAYFRAKVRTVPVEEFPSDEEL